MIYFPKALLSSLTNCMANTLSDISKTIQNFSSSDVVEKFLSFIETWFYIMCILAEKTQLTCASWSMTIVGNLMANHYECKSNAYILKHQFKSNIIIFVYIKSFIVRSQSSLTIFDY